MHFFKAIVGVSMLYNEEDGLFVSLWSSSALRIRVWGLRIVRLGLGCWWFGWILLQSPSLSSPGYQFGLLCRHCYAFPLTLS